MVGLVNDIRTVVGLGWRQPGDVVVLLGLPPEDGGDDRLGLAGSSYQQLVLGDLAGWPPRVDLTLEAAVQSLVRRAISAGLIASAHDSSDGGLAVALAESSIASGLGVELDLTVSKTRLDRVLFAEGGARIVVSVKAEQVAAWTDLPAKAPEVPATELGRVTAGGDVQIRCGGTLPSSCRSPSCSRRTPMPALSPGVMQFGDSEGTPDAAG